MEISLRSFLSTKGDLDVWMRSAMKPDNTPSYEYALCYVDDILALSHGPGSIVDFLEFKYTLNDGSMKPSDTLSRSTSQMTPLDDVV